MRRAFAAIAMAAVLALGGCAADDGYSDAAAHALQDGVFAVTQLSSQGDYAGALTALADTESRLAEALASGEISQERADEITAAIAGVRGNLNALIAQQQPVTDPGEGDGNNGNGNGNGNGNKPPKDDKDKPGKKD
jgi:hypothetical protein